MCDGYFNDIGYYQVWQRVCRKVGKMRYILVNTSYIMYKLFGKRTMQEILRDKATKMCFCVFLKLNFHQLPIT